MYVVLKNHKWAQRKFSNHFDYDKLIWSVYVEVKVLCRTDFIVISGSMMMLVKISLNVGQRTYRSSSLRTGVPNFFFFSLAPSSVQSNMKFSALVRVPKERDPQCVLTCWRALTTSQQPRLTIGAHNNRRETYGLRLTRSKLPSLALWWDGNDVRGSRSPLREDALDIGSRWILVSSSRGFDEILRS